MTFQIMTDTAADLGFEYLNRNDVKFVGFSVNVNGKDYRTDIPGEIKQEWLLKQLAQEAEVSTSQVNAGQFYEVFKPYAESKTPLLYIGFSSGLSGTLQSSMQAREMILEEFPDADIRVIDTLMAANGQGLLVRRAAKLKEKGATIDEIEVDIRESAPKVRAWFTVDDLKQLARGGRISKTAATIGGLANVKPILDVDHEGKLRAVAKVRGRQKALKHLVDNLVNDLPNPESQSVFINYSGSMEDARKVKAMIEEKVTVKHIFINPLGPTITAHTGSGTIGAFALGKEKRK